MVIMKLKHIILPSELLRFRKQNKKLKIKQFYYHRNAWVVTIAADIILPI